MPLSTVNAGDEILASDINSHITQTNTNTTNIATNTSNISSNTSSINSLNTTVSGHTTSINSINSTLSSYNNVPRDSSLSSSGGVFQCVTVSPAVGSITRLARFSGTGSATVSHGLGATPDIVLLQYAGNFGGPPTHPAYYYGENSSSVTVVADSGFFWYGLALKF